MKFDIQNTYIDVGNNTLRYDDKAHKFYFFKKNKTLFSFKNNNDKKRKNKFKISKESN